MKFIWISTFIALYFKSFCSFANGNIPNIDYFSVPTEIPKEVLSIAGGDGEVPVDPKKSLTWIENGQKHYFLQIQFYKDGGGCGIFDVNQSEKIYRQLDKFTYCKILGKASVSYSKDIGTIEIITKILTRQSGDDYDRDMYLAYLYIPDKSMFCRNDEAASFAAGNRVPNKMVKFKDSNCDRERFSAEFSEWIIESVMRMLPDLLVCSRLSRSTW